MRPALVALLVALSSGCDPGPSPPGDVAVDAATADSHGLTSTCHFDAAAAVGDTCAISDWEHDFTCEYIGPELIWLCCRDVTGTGGGECQYASCPTELGEPCCDGGPSTGAYVCVDGRWAAP